jgi:hypothetical protein
MRVNVRGTLGKRTVHAYLWTENLIRTYRVIILYNKYRVLLPAATPP